MQPILSRRRLHCVHIYLSGKTDGYFPFDLPMDPATTESLLFPGCDFLPLLFALSRDVHFIADVISRGYYYDYYDYSRQATIFQRLRTIMGDREFWVTNSVRLQNRIIRWIDIRFPEYFSVFKDWTCKRSLATLKEFPFPQDIESLSVSEVITGWRGHMQRVGGFTGMQTKKR